MMGQIESNSLKENWIIYIFGRKEIEIKKDRQWKRFCGTFQTN
jgi:hypothetical protein